VGAALGAGGACLVVTTIPHRAALVEQLKRQGIDVTFVTAMDRFIALDVSGMLARFMVDDRPDEKLFNDTIEPHLVRVRHSLGHPSASVVAFSEMVTVLCQQGNCEAAIELERLWEELARRQNLSLRCAYPVGIFSDQSQFQLFRQVCAHHNQVVPSKGFDSLENDRDLHGMVSPRKARTMRAVMQRQEEQIARLQNMEAKLQRSDEFIRRIAECGVDCLKVFNLEGRLEYINPAGIRALEMDDAAPLLGRPWVDSWNPEDRSRAEAAFAVARGGGAGSFVGELTTQRGSRKWWDVKIAPALDPSGNVERIIAISREITELRLAQKAAIEAERQATAGRMAGTIAHEINNPLEAVTNFIYLAMTTEGVPQDAIRYLQIADREMGRAAQISRQTLGFYRGGSTRNWVSVSELFEDILTIYSRKIRARQLTVRIAVDPSLEVYGKDGELRQVLSNLTGNAVDASRQGGTLWFRAHRTRNWKSGGENCLRITLADNGLGIAPEVKGRIFVPFFTTKSGSGTGLGLWVTKCLIEQQGGYIHFRSRQGERSGTVMSFVLPALRNAADKETEAA
jgi:PAS domain S-box-containing protein